MSFSKILNSAFCILAALFFTASLPRTANSYETIYTMGPGIENLSWCTDPKRARSKLSEKNMEKCTDDRIRHGNRSENELGLSAIKEICLGHDSIAQSLIKACQCHNNAGYNAVIRDWAKVKAWALKHPYCRQWTKLTEQAQACRAKGDTWHDDTRTCEVKEIGGQIDSACLSRRLVSSSQGSTNIEFANQCGQCVIMRWQQTLDGSPEFGLFEDRRMESGGATTVRMMTGRPGVHDIAVLAVYGCNH